MGSEIAAVPDISEGLAEISKKMMDLAAQLRAWAVQSVEHAASLKQVTGASLKPRGHAFKQRTSCDVQGEPQAAGPTAVCFPCEAAAAPYAVDIHHGETMPFVKPTDNTTTGVLWNMADGSGMSETTPKLGLAMAPSLPLATPTEAAFFPAAAGTAALSPPLPSTEMEEKTTIFVAVAAQHEVGF
uniref:Uncharacterized protein n=1 Tax=Oryza rufipogon TaxID=4529 RepID=A0A0E0QY14_ORYRU